MGVQIAVVVLIVVYVIQILMLVGYIITDGMVFDARDKKITKKKDVIPFLIPLAWIPMFFIISWKWYKELG